MRLTSISSPWVWRTLMLVASILAVALFLRMDGAGAQTDDHADYITGATHLPLGSSIAGRIDSGDDIDVFRLDISGSSATTDVWVYTTGRYRHIR